MILFQIPKIMISKLIKVHDHLLSPSTFLYVSTYFMKFTIFFSNSWSFANSFSKVFNALKLEDSFENKKIHKLFRIRQHFSNLRTFYISILFSDIWIPVMLVNRFSRKTSRAATVFFVTSRAATAGVQTCLTERGEGNT